MPTRWIKTWLIGCLILSSQPRFASAELMFNFIYEDVNNNTNVGFDDPVFGAARRATLDAVGEYIGDQLDPLAYTATVDFRLENSQTDATGFLGSASIFYFLAPNGFFNGLLYDHATTSVDPFGGLPDAYATFDFGYAWHTGTSPNPGGLFDLFSVALHEITHAMGFLSELNPTTGTSFVTGTNPGVYTVYDSFLELGDGTNLFTGSPGTFTGSLADLSSEDIYFNGPNVLAANGGNPVKIFAPNPVQVGSSLSHFDDSILAVMDPFSPLGTMSRDWTALDRAVLQDIGWQFASVSAVPEPSGLALIACGLIGLAFRQRSRGRETT